MNRTKTGSGQMRRKGLIAIMAAVMVMISTAMVFADEDAFKLVSSYPTDGQTNTSIENLGVKLQFNHSLSSDAAQKNNESCVKIINKDDGSSVPIKVLASDDQEGLLLVLGDSTSDDLDVESNQEYELVISGDLVDDEGNTLGTEQTVTFKTFNQRLNTAINMIMMIAMFGGIMYMTIRQQRQTQEEETPEEKKDTFNPYREAKRTGKTVEEVTEEHRKQQEKAAKKAKRKKKNAPQEDYVKDSNLKLSEILPNVYSVPRPRPISEAGGKYKSGRAPKEEVKKRGPRNTSSPNRR